MNFVPLWIWPVLVCVGAWLFRRWVLRGAVPRQGIDFRIPLPFCAGGTANGFQKALLGAGAPAAGRSGIPFLPTLLSHWKNLVARRSEGEASIVVLARRAVGPQQQVLILRAGNGEHTVLLQSGTSPLLLSSQRSRCAFSSGGKQVRPRFPRRRSRLGLGIASRRLAKRRSGDDS